MLMGMFWEVEHSALYKPSPELRGMERSAKLSQLSEDVVRSLKAFEAGFERLLEEDPYDRAT
jgi:hypothetical protein